VRSCSAQRMAARCKPSFWQRIPLALAGSLLFAHQCAMAQIPPGNAPAPAAAPAGSQATDGTLAEWLLRLHKASMQNRAYIGTFVVSSGGNMSSARIWHVCEGDQQMERVENLTGPHRSTFRHNAQVVTFIPDLKVARTESRESLGLFPELLKANAGSIPEFYQARKLGNERVAGLDADVVQLQPRDSLRFGYRVWTERRTGMVVKLQTLDVSGKVLEQSAFSELQLDAPVHFEKLAQMMANTDGYRQETHEIVKTTALAEGWSLRSPVPGFAPLSCYRRALSGNAVVPTLQWVFSDGLATVSLFVEPFDRQRHLHEATGAMGATQTLTRKMEDPGSGREWWLTAVGEVPATTLNAFATALVRSK